MTDLKRDIQNDFEDVLVDKIAGDKYDDFNDYSKNMLDFTSSNIFN